MITAILSGVTVGGWLAVGSYGVESWGLTARAVGIPSQPKPLFLFTCPVRTARKQPNHVSLPL